MLTFEDAQAALLTMANEPSAEPVALAHAAGRVLLEDVVAPADSPAFDASMMDGYAVRAPDAHAGARLVVRGESKTGAPFSGVVAPGSACRIFTGAVMPSGADAVVMQEDVTREGDEAVVGRAAKPGQHVRKRAEDLRAGDVAIAMGTRLGPAHLSLAATMERRELVVARAPRVSLLATGDELRDPGTPGPAGSIPESNGVAIAAMARRAGAVVTELPRMKDDLTAMTDALSRALSSCDVLVTIGGVSVGEHDVVKPALLAAGASIDFWRVAIKPGKPLCVGRKGDAIVVGLPGNPASAMVTFALFGLPLLRGMQGDRSPWPAPLRLPLAHALDRPPPTPGRLEFARATIDAGHVSLVAHQSSGSSLGVARAHALAAIPAECTHLDRGAAVDVYPFSELGL